MVSIKILGSGCAKCKRLDASVREIVAKNDLNAAVIKVEDVVEIMKYGILSTPGLVINEKVKSAGTVPSDEQIRTWINKG